MDPSPPRDETPSPVPAPAPARSPGWMHPRLHRAHTWTAAWWRRAGWSDFVLLLSVGAICGCLWAFVGIAEEVFEGEHDELEQRLMLALRVPGQPHQPIGPWWLKESARDFTALGGATVVVTMTLLTLAYLWLSGKRATALLVVAAVGGGYGLSTLLKTSFDRTRPDAALHLVEVTSASFPSGHSMLSSVVYVTLGAVLAGTARRRREKIFVLGAALLLALLVGLSRIFLGVHYPTDVLAGWSAGTAWATLCWLVARALERRRQAAAVTSTNVHAS